MADIVIGIASSHTPQLSSGVDMWPDHALRDQRYALLGKDARYHTYEETLAGADPGIARELEPDVWAGKYQRVQAAIESLSAALAAAGADLALVIGDDQRELFIDDGIPAFACFTGTELLDMAPDAETFAKLPKGIQAAYWAVHGEEKAVHPVAQQLSAYIAERLALADFDLTVFTRQPAGRTLGHAFTFPRYRLGLPASTPIVPVFVNTYYPPNVPSAARCFALGRELRRAVEAWESGRAGRRDRLGRADPLRHRRDARPRCPRLDRRQGRGRAQCHPPRQAPLGELGDPQLGHRRRGTRRPLGDHRRLRSRLPYPGWHRHRHGLRPLGLTLPFPHPRSPPPSCEVTQR